MVFGLPQAAAAPQPGADEPPITQLIDEAGALDCHVAVFREYPTFVWDGDPAHRNWAWGNHGEMTRDLAARGYAQQEIDLYIAAVDRRLNECHMFDSVSDAIGATEIWYRYFGGAVGGPDCRWVPCHRMIGARSAVSRPLGDTVRNLRPALSGSTGS